METFIKSKMILQEELNKFEDHIKETFEYSEDNFIYLRLSSLDNTKNSKRMKKITKDKR